ncbi:MAG: transposase [Spirochaetales bacterium]|nr:transposase [Spirochaetales bacterium]
MAFLGLVPSESSSGGSRRLGSITKAGNSRLRKLLIEASWHYRYLYRLSKRLNQRRKGQKAEIIAYSDKSGKRMDREKKAIKENSRGSYEAALCRSSTLDRDSSRRSHCPVDRKVSKRVILDCRSHHHREYKMDN